MREITMSYSDERLVSIFRRTDGKCHLCGGGLTFSSYGKQGGWEVEHSVPRCVGGTDRLSNLYAAHGSCNRDKGKCTSRTARAWNGRTRAPLCKKTKERVRTENLVGWGSVGAFSGLALGGPLGLILGVVAGAAFGDSLKVE
jgi:hypothetical protein